MVTAEVLRPAGAARSKGLGCCPTSSCKARGLCIDKDIACKALCVQKHCLQMLGPCKGTRTLEQSLVCYTLPEVYRLPVRTYAAIAINAPYRWRSSSHKATLIPQNKRQDTTVIVIPCLCSFNALCSPSAELPINKKRTQTLSHRESGSSTNCMVDGTGLEPVTSCTSSRCSTS